MFQAFPPPLKHLGMRLYTRATTSFYMYMYMHCTIAAGLASCLWLVRTVHYLVMALDPSYGFGSYFVAAVNKVSGRIDYNGDRPGYMNGLFSATRTKP